MAAIHCLAEPSANWFVALLARSMNTAVGVNEEPSETTVS